MLRNRTLSEDDIVYHKKKNIYTIKNIKPDIIYNYSKFFNKKNNKQICFMIDKNSYILLLFLFYFFFLKFWHIYIFKNKITTTNT